MNVLSLFDGMSCGQQALERANIKVDNYFASEIDKYAIQVTMANYPNTIQLGSVVNVEVSKLPKIDLLIGGSPCQSFSFAGKRKGMSTKDNQEILTLEHYLQLKAEDYEFQGQSYLFWEYMRILNEIRKTNPNVLFLLENVIMADNWEKVLSNAIGVKPIEINSALVSAQNRRRLYWTNIGLKPSGLFGDLESIIEQPKDKGIKFIDIINHKYQFQPLTNWVYKKWGNSIKLNQLKSIYESKSNCLTTAKNHSKNYYLNKTKDKIRMLERDEVEKLQTVKEGYTNIISKTQAHKMLGNGWTIDVIAHIFSYLNK
jgi:DNA (cytosine-5)-methyltransferase 3A